MTRFTRFVATVLSLLLAAALLAGCGPTGAEPTPTPDQGPDLTLPLAGIPRDETLFTINGVPVPAEEYLFWLSQSADYLLTYSGSDTVDWEADLGGTTVAQSLKEDALYTCTLFAVLSHACAQRDIVLSQEDEATYYAEMADVIEQQGGQERYDLWLAEAPVTSATMDRINLASYRYPLLQSALYGAQGELAPTAEDMDAYIEENDLLSAKHILISTVDTTQVDPDTGGYLALEESVLAEKLALAEDILARLNAVQGEAQLTLFDELMFSLGEDPGVSTSPDGYIFSANEMVPSFEAATRSLEYGGISGLIESDFGYHIILRQDPDTLALRDTWAQSEMDAQLQTWMDEAEVVYSDAYEALDIPAYYAALTTYRAELAAQQAAASPSPDPAPAASPGA